MTIRPAATDTEAGIWGGGGLVRYGKTLRACMGAAAAALVASCSMVDTVDPRYDTINRSTTKARNEAILLNIVRASHSVPLNFIAFSRVSGTTQANIGIASPTFVVGPNPVPAQIQRDATINNTTLNTNVLATGSFDITVLESRDFYSALLSPVDLPTLNFFVRQGYSRELMFWLFTDSVRETVGNKTIEYRNEPGAKCPIVLGKERCFDKMVDVAIASGLTVETHQEPRPQRSSGGQSKDRPSSAVHARLCFDPVLARRAALEYDPDVFDALRWKSGHNPTCGHWHLEKHKPGGDILTFELVGTPFGTIKYEIITRSTFGIYQFLGRILARSLTEEVRMRGKLDESEDHRILAITREAGGCFVEINYEGSYYCVPHNGAQNTKRIFSLLVQLLALKTQTGDLAITPTVRVTP